ncbi:MAG: LysR family transcriptional regulator, partial [Paracoccaceae bacterium]
MMSDRLPNLRHLAAFVAVLEHGSATRAAEAVHLTQPALTQAIGRLEQEIGCQLFNREPTGMKPTEPALLLADRAGRAIRLIGSNRVTAAQVRAFRAFAKHGSYSAASEHVGLAPASLHRAVSDLSSALRERLVERRGR